jgi:hypothetical protein
MKFPMNKEKEMKDKETIEGEIGLSHSIYEENNIHLQPYLKEFYLFSQVMGLWILKGIWISSLVSVIFILLNMMM